MSKEFKMLYFTLVQASAKGVVAQVHGLPRLLRSLAMTICSGLSQPYRFYNNTTSVIPAKAGIQESRSQMMCLFLFILLSIPVGCSCFPDQSKEIGKEREWDKKAKIVNQQMRKQDEVFQEGLKKLKNKFPTLDKTQLFKGNDVKDFLQNIYIPYLRAWKAFAEHHVKHEKDHNTKRDYELGVYSSNSYLEKVPRWLQDQDNNMDEMYKLIQALINKK